MLVLSRRPGEKILFPSLGITVEVLRSRGSVVRLGIDAPNEVSVMRGELTSVDDGSGLDPQIAHQTQLHDLRNQLNVFTLKFELLRRQLEVGQVEDPDQALAEALSDLSTLEKRISDTKNVPDDVAGMRVLIVEDHQSERELLASCLRLAGMTVVTLADGNAALEYLKQNEPPELVLLDMRMPGMDGPTFLDAVRKDHRLDGVRVYAVSGSPQTEFSNPLPLDGWFSKPVRVDALLQAMRFEHNSASSTA